MSAGRRKTTLVLADQVIVSGANFAVGLLLARVLGPSGYGEFTLISNFILFVLGIQVSLIDSPMLVLGAALSRERTREYFPAVITGQLWFSVLSVALLLAAVPILSRFAPQWNVQNLAWATIFAMFGFLIQDFSRRYLFVRDRADAALGADLACHGLKFALLAAFGFWWGLNAAQAFWIIGAASIIGVLVAITLGPKREVRGPVSAESFHRTANEHWHFGKWLLAESMASLCASQLVIYTVGHVISVSAVGAMAAAMHIIGANNVLLLALENLVPSRAANRYASGGTPALNRYLRRITLLGGAGMLVIVAVAVLGADFWLRLLYGSAYEGNGRLIVWWGLYYVIGFIQRPFSIGLRVLGNTRGIFHGTLAGAVVAVAISYPATRALGVDGGMLALCLVQTAILCVLCLFYRAALRAQRDEDALGKH
jgi:O-antigen/teichoic acid export membrane protein